jgi:RNA polymerase sigma-70 factor (ECF subfamily)
VSGPRYASSSGSDADDRTADDRTDAELLAAHVAGDAAAFGEIVARHQNRLWAVAVRTLSDREEAADALQDALVSAYRRAGTYRGEAAVTTWLHRIVVNACLDRMRRRAVRPTVELPERELADPRDEHSATEAALDVRAALARLPEHQRAALVLVDMHGLSVAEAAQVLDVAEGTVKSRCARGRSAMHTLLTATTARNPNEAPRVPPVATNHPEGGRA